MQNSLGPQRTAKDIRIVRLPMLNKLATVDGVTTIEGSMSIDKKDKKGTSDKNAAESSIGLQLVVLNIDFLSD